jgi:hypothetical protein
VCIDSAVFGLGNANVKMVGRLNKRRLVQLDSPCPFHVIILFPMATRLSLVIEHVLSHPQTGKAPEQQVCPLTDNGLTSLYNLHEY